MGHHHDRGMLVNTNARDGMKYKPRHRFRHVNKRRLSPSSSSSALISKQGKKYCNFYDCKHSNCSQRSFFITKEQHQQAIQAPHAPRNTTSYIIRSKFMHSLAPVVTPSPFTPPVLPTPRPSRYKEQFAEEVSEWGVNGYGSMNGLIRVKADVGERDIEDASTSQFNSLELQRLNHDLSRFEMVCPEQQQVQKAAAPLSLEVRLVDQEHHIAALEEENMYLRQRLRSVEHELDGLRTRMQLLEGEGGVMSSSGDYGQGEVVSEKSTCNVDKNTTCSAFAPRSFLAG